MAATGFELLGELEEELEEEAAFRFSPEYESQLCPRALGETEWEYPVGCPTPTRTVLSGFPRYSVSVATLPRNEQNKLKGIASLIARSSRPGCRPIRHVRLVGHADRDVQRGPAFEKSVSLQRALEVQRAIQGLLRSSGVSSPIQWVRVGAGAVRPVVPAAYNEQQRALNRRVEITLGGRRPPSSSIEELGRITSLIGLKLSNTALQQLQSGQTVSLAGRSPQEIRGAMARARAHFSRVPSGASEAFALPSWIRDCSRAGCDGACVVVKRGRDRFGRGWVACLCIGFFWARICSQWLPPPLD